MWTESEKEKNKMTFKERAKLGMELLAKQSPVTLEQAREQGMRIKIRSSRGHDKQEIKNLLRIYYPDWIEEQIECEYQRLIKSYSK